MACGDFCRLMIALANSLDQDQDRHDIDPDLDPNRLTVLDSVPERIFFEKVNFENIQQMTTKA